MKKLFPIILTVAGIIIASCQKESLTPPALPTVTVTVKQNNNGGLTRVYKNDTTLIKKLIDDKDSAYVIMPNNHFLSLYMTPDIHNRVKDVLIDKVAMSIEDNDMGAGFLGDHHMIEVEYEKGSPKGKEIKQIVFYNNENRLSWKLIKK